MFTVFIWNYPSRILVSLGKLCKSKINSKSQTEEDTHDSDYRNYKREVSTLVYVPRKLNWCIYYIFCSQRISGNIVVPAKWYKLLVWCEDGAAQAEYIFTNHTDHPTDVSLQTKITLYINIITGGLSQQQSCVTIVFDCIATCMCITAI